MWDLFKTWYKHTFHDPQALVLLVILLIASLVILTFGDLLAPLLGSIVVAYILDAAVGLLSKWGANRNLSVWFVFSVFFGGFLFLIFGVIPLLWSQATGLAQELPNIIGKWWALLESLPEKYPGFITRQQITDSTALFLGELRNVGQFALSHTASTLFNAITLMVYLILVPLLVFFLLKDKTLILQWVLRYLPADRSLTRQVWIEMEHQIGNYLRGKVLEIFIVGSISWGFFVFMELRYALLLAVLIGLSVIIPYVGATVVTIPVAVIAYFQWGWGSEFGYLMIGYLIIQILDGNLLVPVLFSEAVNLHPIAIVLSILVFGGLWGIWGVFFAIPLATLVKTVLNQWPRPSSEKNLDEEPAA